VPSNFLPFGNGELLTPRLDNGSSEAFNLQQPFKYFGRTYNQTFVSIFICHFTLHLHLFIYLHPYSQVSLNKLNYLLHFIQNLLS